MEAILERKKRLELAIERNRNEIRNGGDLLYHTRKILYLNGLLNEIDNID